MSALGTLAGAPRRSYGGAIVLTRPIFSWLMPGLGVTLVGAAMAAARFDHPAAWSAYWIGLILLVASLGRQAIMATDSDGERRVALVQLVVGLTAVKLLHSPIGFTFHDEFVHLQTLQDILVGGRLFTENPQVPASPVFPGLELVSAALVQTAAIDPFAAGMVVIVAGRVILVLCLFALYESVTASASIAALATTVYLANPNFVYFGAQYSYESLALPLALVTLLLVARSFRRTLSGRVGLAVVLGGVVVSHHLTSYALSGFLILWGLAIPLCWLAVHTWSLGRRFGHWYAADVSGRRLAGGVRVWIRALGWRWRRRPSAPLGLGILAAGLAGSWLVLVAPVTVRYLVPVAQNAGREAMAIALSEQRGRALFQSLTGERPPIAEQILGYLAVLGIVLVLPFGLLAISRSWRRRPALGLALGMGALVYPGSLALRFSNAGWEISNRSSEFLFVAVGFVVAIGLSSKPLDRLPRSLIAPLVTLLILGGMVTGWPHVWLMPGPYRVSSDSRSIEPQGIEAARWSQTALGAKNRFSADRINRLLLSTHGRQRVIMAVTDDILVAPVFFAPSIGRAEVDILERAAVRYVLVDRRLTEGIPFNGYYFEPGEPGTNRHRLPFEPAAIAKWDRTSSASRLFDSGSIAVFDVGRLSGADRQSPARSFDD